MQTVTIAGLMGGVFQVKLTQEVGKNTVKELKKAIAAQAGRDIDPETMRLLFAGKQLENQDQYGEEQILKDYHVVDGSLLQLVIRLPGGLAYQQPKQYDPNTHQHFQLTREPDILAKIDDQDDYRAMMLPCKHPVDPDALTSYAKTEADKGELKIRCPECKVEWPYNEVRDKALLTAPERMDIEQKLSQNVAMANDIVKQCPECSSYVERAAVNNQRVLCVLCTKKLGRNYEFCWNCLSPWVGPGRENKCGRPVCENSTVKLLRDCDEIQLGRVKNVRVPRYRACPSCSQLIEHDTNACKNIKCIVCQKEFCFLCLKFSHECLKTSSHFAVCTIAPRQ